MLLILTPIGVAGGLYQGWRLAGGLVFLMATLLAGITAAVWALVATIRREQREATDGHTPTLPPPQSRSDKGHRSVVQ